MALIIKRAETWEEIEAAQRLAQEVYVEELNFVDMNDFKRATEPYEDCSLSFVAIMNGKVVGTMKLVSHYGTGKLPMEEAFELPHFLTYQRGRALEVSRAAIRKDIRGDKISHAILLGMLKAIYIYAKENHFVYLAACMYPQIFKTLIEKLNWNFQWIGAGNADLFKQFLIPVILEIRDENVNFEIKKIKPSIRE